MNETSKWVEEKYLKLFKKYVRSRFWFILLNIISFTLVASMVILNIYAIKMNPFEDTVPCYVAIAIMTGFIGLLTSIISFFTFNKNSNIYKEQYKEILDEYRDYKKQNGIYSEDDTRDEILIDRIQEIINK